MTDTEYPNVTKPTTPFTECTKLSELLRYAVVDAMAVERGELKYRGKQTVLNMGQWVTTSRDLCEVCMAGAVLVGEAPERLPLNGNYCFSGDDPSGTEMRLDALDSLRTGHVGWACVEMGIRRSDFTDFLEERWNTTYNSGNADRLTWHQYAEMIEDLEEAGL